jgi:putative DNA primase/helicase
VWNGSYRETGEGALIHTKGLETVRNICDDVLSITDYREHMEIGRYAMLSESMRRREAFVKAASLIRKLNITSDNLDKDPRLLNVKNGTAALTTGEFREHRQEDMITKITGTKYDPRAGCPLWKKFIREIMNRKSGVISFVQTAAGWALTGGHFGTDDVYPVRERGQRQEYVSGR